MSAWTRKLIREDRRRLGAHSGYVAALLPNGAAEYTQREGSELRVITVWLNGRAAERIWVVLRNGTQIRHHGIRRLSGPIR